MSEQEPTKNWVNIEDVGLYIFLAVCVVTCGWAPNCNKERVEDIGQSDATDESAQQTESENG